VERSPDAAASPASLVSVQTRMEAYWERTGVPARAAAGAPDGPIFRFTEGPPTANGRPHVGHLVARILKDVALRYRRMRGYRIVSPMAGWDCHGLPVELEIEKRLGIKSKREIELYGVERFSDACRASVLEVASVWQEMSRKLGYWLDYGAAYRTMDAPYIESVWWSLKQLFEAGLLEKGYYVLPYCPRCETPLASHEVAQGYREATDPSVTLRLRLTDAPGPAPEFLLVWTTTPWTLPANLLVAARAELTYVGVDGPEGARYWLAEPALARYAKELGEVRERRAGRSFEGRGYAPPFPFAGPGTGRYRVVLDPMVDASEGTGFVHIAPSFGPDDQRIGEREGVGLFDPLDSRGVFTDKVPTVHGKSFKVADALLLEALRADGSLVRAETLRHTYPFCWRCDTPLLYRALDSWFVRTSRFTDRLVRHNAGIAWHPAHLRDGRFGNFLTEAKDWALSRNRYWGTPLPVWLCPQGHATCIGSFEELSERLGRPLPATFDPHRAGVDPLRFPCPQCGQEARREPYTIDGWYDSGSAPFAQFHYPFEPGPFDTTAPLDFIAEGLDQTRGWFYTLHVLASALYDRPAFKVCVVNGMVLDEGGRKMSKSKGNVLDPMVLLDKYGADAVRWAFLSVDFSEPTRVGDPMFRLAGGRTLGTLLNVLSFYRENAAADGVAGATTAPNPPGTLDRWILSRLDATVEEVTQALEGSEDREAVRSLALFVDDLSVWYLRRSRPRFWSEGNAADRAAAYGTLSFSLRTLALLLAPVAPFTAEHLYQTLAGRELPEAGDSVHLASWPTALGRRDATLETAMAARRQEAEVGRELRQRAQLRSRLPLPEMILVGATDVDPELDGLLAGELNVQAVRRLSEAKDELFPETAYVRTLDGDGRIRAALPRTVPPELLAEGWRREGLRRLQSLRKERRLAFTQRIELDLRATGSLLEALRATPDRLREELLADRLQLQEGEPPEDPEWVRWEIDGEKLAARLRTAPAAS
jgi:isoleucyl-tRNA synthetase